MIGGGWVQYAAAGFVMIEAQQREIERAREVLAPAEFEAWRAKRQAEQLAERRHREICRSIEQAGRNARPSGLGIFW